LYPVETHPHSLLICSSMSSSSSANTITTDSPQPIWKWDLQTIAHFIRQVSKRGTSSTAPQSEETYKLYANLVTNLKNFLQTGADPYSINAIKIEQKVLPGAILIKLQLGGIINAVSGIKGGVTEPYVTNLADCKRMWKSEANEHFKNLQKWYEYANVLKAAVNARVAQDKIEEMPQQIVEMMCGSEINIGEVQNLRSRVYQTVVLNNGTHASARLRELEGGGNDIVLAKAATHKVEQYHKCNQCGNADQGAFVMDKKNGDVICSNCGMVVVESLMHEGSQFRNFEGEADRNHHGDTANPLFSDAHNMSTGLSVANDSQIGDTTAKNLQTILKNAHTYTEMNISQFGAKERKTRTGYKDKQKKDAFMQMQHVGYALSLHESIVQYAKELFSGFRDDRELVQHYKGILAACLLESFDKFSKEGKQILKQKMEHKTSNSTDAVRSNWRDNMHDNAASKFEASTKIAFVEEEKHQQPVSEWSLENVRSWLTSTSHKLAVENGGGDELEGQYVEFSLKLVEYLQKELEKSGMKTNGRKGAVSTPRVDMANLQIKWQKLDSFNGTKTKTAGQLLILKSVKKLVQITSDEKSSAVFHKELRSLLTRQSKRKRNASSAELEEQRLAQMKRKPWLQTKLNA